MKPSPVPAAIRVSPRFGEITRPVADQLAAVESALQAELLAFDPGLADMVADLAVQKGKRLRPLLALLSGRAAGELAEDHVRLGVIVELIHTASLLHDDVLDGAELRRSRPAANMAWGAGSAVLLGDTLFSHALEVAASFPTTEVCRRVADAAKRTCTGEILQTRRSGDMELTRKDYLDIIELKTAALFATSCFLGVRVAGGNSHDAEILAEFGRRLGRAYQVYDDCVDVFGEETKAGKSLGTDLAAGKLTLPAILLLERAGDGAAGKRLRFELTRAAEENDRRAWAERCGEAGIREKCAEVFHEEIEAAQQALARWPEPGRAGPLGELAAYLDAAGQAVLEQEG